VLYYSSSMCVGVTVWFGWGGVVSLCRLKPLFSFSAAKCPHQLLGLTHLPIQLEPASIPGVKAAGKLS